MVANKQVIYVKVPTTFPVVGEHIKVVDTDFDLDASLAEGEFIVKTLVLSVDPYMRGRMRPAHIKSYVPAFIEGQPMTGHVVVQVVKSNSANYKVNDYLYGYGHFVNYARMNDTEAKALGLAVRNDIPKSGLPLTNYVGALGMPGATAYVGLKTIGEPKEGETIFVSAASGAVGQIVGQLAKVKGLRVIGSAGSDDKVAHLKSIGFDGAFNYKTESTDTKLTELAPNGVDIYFENVGGETLETVINHMNPFGRIIACGMISQYNTQEPYGVRNLIQVVAKRLRFQGFIVHDHPELEVPFREEVTKYLQGGKFQYREDIAKGIESTPDALVAVLKGTNFGKQVVTVAEP
ncbi:hypothetical protein BC940DRAFT_337644 [Gongronella butleri]|nr:hypothetical protein BC940DRAFT_337644 [Gongronella butleri]